MLSKLKEFHHFLQIPEHSVLVPKRTDHAKSQVVAKRMVDVELARSIGGEEGIVQS